jgi:poly(A) polymerase
MFALARTDERVRAGKRVSPGFLFATLLWHEVLTKWNARIAAGEHRMPALEAAIDQVLDSQTEKLAIQRRFTSDMREIWTLQPRFERRTGQAPLRLLEHLRLRAGYDFLLLRCAAEEAAAELGQWWTRFIDGSDEERAALMQEASKTRTSAPDSRRRRRPRRRPAAAA